MAHKESRDRSLLQHFCSSLEIASLQFVEEFQFSLRVEESYMLGIDEYVRFLDDNKGTLSYDPREYNAKTYELLRPKSRASQDER